MRPRPRLHVPVALALCLASCANDGRINAPGDFQVGDSAGVAIAHSEGPFYAFTGGIRVSAGPIVEIGLEAGPDPHLLSGVAGADRLFDGTIIVCNAADRTIRYYGPDGSFLRQGAGEGGGPGELRRMGRCFLRDDQVLVYQAPALPIEVFDADGRHVRSVPLPRPNGRVAPLVDIGPGQSLVQRQDALRRDLAVGISILETSVYRTGADGQPMLLGTFPGGHWLRTDRVTFPAAFTPTLRVAARGDATVVGWPAVWDLALVDRVGVPLLRMRRAFIPAAVTSRHRSAMERRILEGPMPGGDTPYENADVRRAIADATVYPESFPAYYRVLASSDGRLWVERGDGPRDPVPEVAEPHDEPTTWDVFGRPATVQGFAESHAAAWLDGVELPPRFDLLSAGADYLVGLHRDELGVERVRVYGLVEAAR